MEAPDLYKFIEDNNVEWHEGDNDGTPDVVIFPTYYEIKEFSKLLSSGIFDEEGIDCVMKDGYFAIWMKYICEYHGVELEKVFIKKKD